MDSMTALSNFTKKALENNPDNEWTAVVAQALAAIYHRIKGNFDAAISIASKML